MDDRSMPTEESSGCSLDVPTMSTEAGARIVRGHSIQSATVYDHLGKVWGIFDTHAEARTAVDAYKAGLEVGKALGTKEAQKRICDALGLI